MFFLDCLLRHMVILLCLTRHVMRNIKTVIKELGVLFWVKKFKKSWCNITKQAIVTSFVNFIKQHNSVVDPASWLPVKRTNQKKENLTNLSLHVKRKPLTWMILPGNAPTQARRWPRISASSLTSPQSDTNTITWQGLWHTLIQWSFPNTRWANQTQDRWFLTLWPTSFRTARNSNMGLFGSSMSWWSDWKFSFASATDNDLSTTCLSLSCCNGGQGRATRVSRFVRVVS